MAWSGYYYTMLYKKQLATPRQFHLRQRGVGAWNIPWRKQFLCVSYVETWNFLHGIVCAVNVFRNIQLKRFRAWAYGISATPFRGEFIGLRNKPAPLVEAKMWCESAHNSKLKKKILFKTNKKYIFSEGKQFPLSAFQVKVLLDLSESW